MSRSCQDRCAFDARFSLQRPQNPRPRGSPTELASLAQAKRHPKKSRQRSSMPLASRPGRSWLLEQLRPSPSLRLPVWRAKNRADACRFGLSEILPPCSLNASWTAREVNLALDAFIGTAKTQVQTAIKLEIYDSLYAKSFAVRPFFRTSLKNIRSAFCSFAPIS